MTEKVRLINAYTLMKNIGKIPQLRGITYGRMDKAVQETPTIEAEPVRHATYDAGGDCTNCGYPMPTYDRFDVISPDEIKYCYHCGAKMDAKEEAACD